MRKKLLIFSVIIIVLGVITLFCVKQYRLKTACSNCRPRTYDYTGAEYFFTWSECVATGGTMVFSDIRPSATAHYFFEYSDEICGTSGTLLGQEYSDAIGYYCCRY